MTDVTQGSTLFPAVYTLCRGYNKPCCLPMAVWAVVGWMCDAVHVLTVPSLRGSTRGFIVMDEEEE